MGAYEAHSGSDGLQLSSEGGRGYRTSGASFGGGGSGYSGGLPGNGVYYRGRGMNPLFSDITAYAPRNETEERGQTLNFQNAAADRAAKQDRFNQVFGALRGMMGGGFGGPFTAGGQSGAGPNINAGPTFNPQQIDQQVNAARASNDASTQNRLRAGQQDLAGRGFASTSPLMAALAGNLGAANVAANSDAERQIRLGAAEQNATAQFRGQQAREAQYASRMAEDIERRKPFFQTTNALISALSGLA